MRKTKVEEKIFFPGRKPRREKCNLADLIRKSEEDYVNFQEAGAIKLSFLILDVLKQVARSSNRERLTGHKKLRQIQKDNTHIAT